MSLLPLALVLSLARPAAAGEALFNRTYTTDTVPADRWQLEQDVRHRAGRASGSYEAFDVRTALAYGLRDDLQFTVSATLLGMNAAGAPDDYQAGYSDVLNRHAWNLESVGFEFLRRFSSPETHPLGFALALEPVLEVFDFHNGRALHQSCSLRARAIVQKDFLGDRLITVLNTSLVGVTEQTDGPLQSRENELDWYSELSATMRVAPRWYAGAETRNYNDYPDQHRRRNTTWSAGPVLHYGAQRFWITAGILFQVYGTPYSSGNLYLRGSERREANLKLGFPF